MIIIVKETITTNKSEIMRVEEVHWVAHRSSSIQGYKRINSQFLVSPSSGLSPGCSECVSRYR